MKFSDELLLAFVDGELAEPARAAVERAMRADPAIAARIARHRALQGRGIGIVAGAREGNATGRASAAQTGAKVVRLDVVRAARHGPLPHAVPYTAPQPAPPPAGHWWQAARLLGAVVLGLLAGGYGWHIWQNSTTLAVLHDEVGMLSAQGRLATALDEQLAERGPAGSVAGEPRAAPTLRVGISFLALDGKYCRSFELADSAGLACRDAGHWRIPVLVEGRLGTRASDTRAQPPALLDAIGARIAGAPLGAVAERAAQARGWTTER